MDTIEAAELIDAFEDAAKEYARCSAELTDAGDRIPDRISIRLDEAREALMDALTSANDSGTEDTIHYHAPHEPCTEDCRRAY
jgi:uncharacterized protein YcgI (DUF1989 family)